MSRYIGYTEIVIGLGQILGPILGGVIYEHFKFDNTMYFFGALNLLGMALCCVFIPKQIDYTDI